MKGVLTASIGLAVISSAFCVASDANAGLTYGPSEYCASGVCYGTMAGFENGSNPNDYAYFQVTPTYNNGNFYASYAGTQYSCYVPSGSGLIPGFPLTLSPMGFFYISWNSSGQCTGFYVINGSFYHNTW
jgi:hypothetical protein